MTDVATNRVSTAVASSVLPFTHSTSTTPDLALQLLFSLR